MSRLTLKLLVIAFLAELPKSKTEQFNKAFELYRKSPHKNLGIERRLNMAGFTEEGLKNLLYDLQQMHGVSDVEIKSYKKPTEEKQEDIIVPTCIPDYVLEMSPEELKEWAKIECTEKGVGIPELIALAEKENMPEITEVLMEAQKELSLEENLEEVGSTDTPSGKEEKTSDEAQAKSIREEYPFLNEKDCPEELLIVVGKKIAAWKRYQDLHERIQNFNPDNYELGEKVLDELTAASVKEYEDNQALDAELKHYAENKEVLAKHESLIEFRVKKEVEQMSNDELMKFVNSSKTFFTRNKTALNKADGNAEKIAEINAKVSEREMKLKLVKNKLGIN